MTLEVSVIVTLDQHRGLALECIESWVAQQSFPSGDFELIVVSPGKELALEERVRQHLRPHDALVRHASDNVASLYRAGARQARGRLLLFSESHCVADAACLTGMVRYLHATGLDGACCRSVPVCGNFLARMDARLFSEGFQLAVREGNWQFLSLQGVALSRAAYEDAGGFDDRYDRFAETVLAARLRDRGRRLGYAERAAISHHYRPTLKSKLPDLEGFIRGESRYRDDHRTNFEVPSSTWLEDGILGARAPAAVCRRIAAVVGRTFLDQLLGERNRSLLRALLRPLLRFSFLSWLGERGLESLAFCAMYLAAFRCHVWRFHERRLERAYRAHRQWAARLCRFRYLRGQPPTERRLPRELGTYDVADLPDGCLVGCHVPEKWEGDVFRWTGPVFAICLALAPRHYLLRLDTHSLRGPNGPPRLRAFFGSHALPASGVETRDGVVSVRIEPRYFDAAEQVLIFTCDPLRPAELGAPDPCELGLPVFAIHLEEVRGDRAERRLDRLTSV